MKHETSRLLPSALVAVSLTLTVGCGSDDASPGPDAGVDTGAVACPAPIGDPVDHSGFVESNETWGAGVHTVSSTVTVRPGVTLSIEPCAVVRLAPDQSIEVDDEDAHLVARGEPDRPIRFERLDAAQAWGSLNVFAPGTIELAYATLDGGGTTAADPLGADLVGASLAGRNQTGTPADTLLVEFVTVTGSAGLGVLLDSSGFLAGSTELAVSDSGLNPVYLGAGYASNLPRLAVSNNGDDRVLLQSAGPAVYDSSEPILADATLPDPGVPYLVGIEGSYPSIVVGDSRSESPSATLTIEPGVELHFQGGQTTSAGILVRGKQVGTEWVEQGSLVAVGTAAEPIVMRSAEPTPAPGDWQGLYFQYVVSPDTELAYVELSHAGGESSTVGRCVATPAAPDFDADCSVVLSLEAAPARPFIADSIFADGKGCGIYRGWADTVVDLAAGNTFVGLSGCDQSNLYSEAASACVGGACE